MHSELKIPSLHAYIAANQVDAIEWKAERLLGNCPSAIVKGERTRELATTIALIADEVVRDEYMKRIGKMYDIKYPAFKQKVDEALKVARKKEYVKREGTKNEVPKLAGKPEVWKFFEEVPKKIKDAMGEEQEVFGKVVIDEERYIELLASFGFTRYEQMANNNERSTGSNSFQFIKLEENIIRSISRNQIIDFIEEFISNRYNFREAGYKFTDSNKLKNHLYRQMHKFFNKDLFDRVRIGKPIIINRDTKEKTFFYYKNGFMEVDKAGYRFRTYDTMDGSVWESQMKDFSMNRVEDMTNATLEDCGMFADFMWKISGENPNRFESLLSITGYVCHDYYQYKLKAINITDSSLSEASEGRTGKTLWAKMLGNVKALCEINGKDFKTDDPRKYEQVELGTQIIMINDLLSHGRHKFEPEGMLNDVTEQYKVDKKYANPFTQQSKFLWISNKTLNVKGASQRDRILEYEWSPFFSENLSPEQHYGCWFGRDWDDKEWHKFHNFMALCSHVFHRKGLQQPESINLGERKLLNHTAQEFLDFMDDCRDSLFATGIPWEGYKFTNLFTTPVKGCTVPQFEFDKKQMFDHFIKANDEFKSWLTPRKFNEWCVQFAQLRMSIKQPRQWRSNGNGYIQFVEEITNT